MLQSKAGYIDARPLTAGSQNLLAPHGRTIHQGQYLPKTLSASTSAIVPSSEVKGSITGWPSGLPALGHAILDRREDSVLLTMPRDTPHGQSRDAPEGHSPVDGASEG
jgi:hypothetical protein